MAEPMFDADHSAPIYSSAMVAIQAPPEIVWEVMAATVPSTQRRVEPGRLLAWEGKTRGMPSIHVFRLAENDGQTDVVLEESCDGPRARLFQASFQRSMDKAVHFALETLKAEAERRAASVLAVAV